jgi:hypothetical protein
MRLFIAAAIIPFTTCLAFAQTSVAVPDAADLFTDCLRVNNPNGSTVLTSPFTPGFVETYDLPLLGTPPINAFETSSNSAVYYHDLFFSVATHGSGTLYNSEIAWNFGRSKANILNFTVPSASVAMFAKDLIPTIEAKIPKGTYTFTAGAVPLPGGSTPGIFQFQTLTNGVWTVQFSLNVNQPITDSRTVSFPSDTRARWMLYNTTNAPAQATITIRYHNTVN